MKQMSAIWCSIFDKDDRYLIIYNTGRGRWRFNNEIIMKMWHTYQTDTPYLGLHTNDNKQMSNADPLSNYIVLFCKGSGFQVSWKHLLGNIRKGSFFWKSSK